MEPKTKSTSAITVHRIDQEGVITLRGLHALTVARSLLEQAVQASGYAVTFDPASAPDLVDYLTVTVSSGIKGAAVGAGLGGLIGMLFGRTRAGAVFGAGVGLAVGTARGVEHVQRGWRVRAVREIDGLPSVTIRALGAKWH